VSWGPSEPPALGTTVTLQVTTPVGPIGVVGVLVEAAGQTWSIRRRDGSISTVAVASIAAGRVVPPSRATRAPVAEVERIAALGWRALEVEALGEWLLRSSAGFTGRANSALALGDPGRPVASAVDAVESWYADRGRPALCQIPDRDAPAGLSEELDRRGWSTSPVVEVMTAELGHVLRAAGGSTDLELRLDREPDDDWLANYRQDGDALPPAARLVLTNHPAAVFASYRDGDRAVAIARAVVDDRWAGLFAVEVAPDHRGLGLGVLVSAAALRWAGRRGARRCYLQVTAANAPAIDLYERLGFSRHHSYTYRYPDSGPEDLADSSPE